MKHVAVVFVIALAFGFLLPMQVGAQDFDRSWAVWKLSLNFKSGKDELYKRNLTKAEAEKLANDLNENNKEWTKYTYHAQQFKEDESTQIRPGRIEMPRVGFIDPGRPKSEAKKVPSLAGKKGKGKIGKEAVTFDFRGKGNSGTVTIRGDLTAEGTWEEFGTGAVYIKIPNAVLRGGTNGKKAAGLCFSEDKSQPPIGWSVIFDESPSSKNDAPDISGTRWVGESDAWVYTFLADGGYSITSPDGSRTEYSRDFKGGTWRRAGGKLLYTDSSGREREMTIKGDRMYGAPGGGAHLTKQK